MKYLRKDGHEFLKNKHSRLRVKTVQRVASPKTPGRVIRIVMVNEVLKRVEGNPVEEGQLLALSFPPDKANADSYTWAPGEECQVPLQISLTQ